MTYLRFAAVALALAASACGRGVETDTPALMPAGAASGVQSANGLVATPAGETVLSFNETQPQYTVSSEIDPAITAFDPALAALIAQAANAEVQAFTAAALADEQAAADEAAANGGEKWFRLHELQLTYKVTAGNSDIISVGRDLFSYTGGAHPNTAMSGAIYTRTSPDPVKLEAIIADLPAYREMVIGGLVEAKMARGWEPSEREMVTGDVRELLTEDPAGMAPFAMVGNIVLAPSDVPGKFGGITVLYSPYDVGSYAEGAYTVTVPSAALEPVLAADWKDRFGGEPVVTARE